MDDLSLAEELIAKDDYMASFDLANQFFSSEAKSGRQEVLRIRSAREGWTDGVFSVSRYGLRV
jgi:hypothetical protein